MQFLFHVRTTFPDYVNKINTMQGNSRAFQSLTPPHIKTDTALTDKATMQRWLHIGSPTCALCMDLVYAL